MASESKKRDLNWTDIFIYFFQISTTISVENELNCIYIIKSSTCTPHFGIRNSLDIKCMEVFSSDKGNFLWPTNTLDWYPSTVNGTQLSYVVEISLHIPYIMQTSWEIDIVHSYNDGTAH